MRLYDVVQNYMQVNFTFYVSPLQATVSSLVYSHAAVIDLYQLSYAGISKCIINIPTSVPIEISHTYEHYRHLIS